MKKLKHIILLIVFLSSVTSRAALTNGDEDFEFSEDATHIPAMIKIEAGDIDDTIEELQAKGVTVLYHRGDILLTFIPVDKVSSLRKAKGVRGFQPGKPRYNRPMMDDARMFNDAYKINEGIDLPKAYDGTGVVVGVCDIGMDTRHPNFMTADGSECRIKKVVHYREEYGERSEFDTPESIYAWETDDATKYHATHVTGIAAGAYPNGFQSLAPGADIIFTASQLSDVGLLAGVEDIIEYAKSVDKPAVINLSMGNILGPRDGTSLFTQYLDRCADDAIICISAGNDGGSNTHGLQFDFTETKSRIEVQTTDWSGMHNRGMAQIWSRDATPFVYSFYLHHNTDKKQNLYSYGSVDFTDPEITEWRVSADPGDPDYNESFAEHFSTGYVRATGGVSPLNGRFYVEMEFDCETEETSPVSNGRWALYWPAIVIEALPGAHVDIHCGYGESFLRQAWGYPAPNFDLSISDLATGFKTISVGMANNKAEETLVDGTVRSTGYPSEGINIHSSYGTLSDGRVLPFTVAPGSMVVSSVSAPFLRNNPDAIRHMNAMAEVNGETAYWMSEIGTSMSCPFVVSAIATWLQVNPGLTSEEAKRIVLLTNRQDFYDPDDPRNGMGLFDAYEGIKLLIGNSLGVEKEELQGVALKYSEGSVYVDNLSGDELKADVISVNGVTMISTRLAMGQGRVDVSRLDKGVYLVSLASPSGIRKIEKIFVR